MSVPNQRDPDLLEAVRALRAEVAELRASTVGRWGHGPQGLASQRPAAAADLDGVIYWATDTDTLSWCDGTGWIIMSEPTQSYTPALANLTVGDGALACTHHRSDGYCDLLFKFTLGPTSAVGTNPSFTLPPGLEVFAAGEVDVATVTLYDSSAVVRKHGTLKPYSPSVLGIQVTDTSAATAGDASITATVPFTWAVSDVIYAAVRYRMTTRYS
jgi:hypothetical protein